MADLAAAGFRPTAAGGALLSGAAAALFEGWARYLPHLLRPHYTATVRAPLLLEPGVLRAARYPDHFPQHMFVARGTLDGAAETRYLTPAACYHVYPLLRGGAVGDGPDARFVTARCARFEAGEWEFPFRLADFQMAELVVVGPEATLDRLRAEVESALGAAFGRLGVVGRFEPATDAFFLGDDDGARLIQKLKGLKREFVAHVGDRRVALASLNNHESYFGRCFDIRTGDGGPASSFCAAFGVERLTAYGLLAWGPDARDWPDELRS